MFIECHLSRIETIPALAEKVAWRGMQIWAALRTHLHTYFAYKTHTNQNNNIPKIYVERDNDVAERI